MSAVKKSWGPLPTPTPLPPHQTMLCACWRTSCCHIILCLNKEVSQKFQMLNSNKFTLSFPPECPVGTFGHNCTKCPPNYYGRLCSSSCDCSHDHVCNPSKGCIDEPTVFKAEYGNQLQNFFGKRKKTPNYGSFHENTSFL